MGMLSGPEMLARCEGALGMMELCFRLSHERRVLDAGAARLLCAAGPKLAEMLVEEQPTAQFAASWALFWLGVCRSWPPSANPDVLGRLFTLWRQSPDWHTKRMAWLALATQPVVSRDDGPRCGSILDADFESLLQEYDRMEDDRERLAVLVVAWYRRTPWSNTEIAARARLLFRERPGGTSRATAEDLLRHVGIAEASDPAAPA